MAKRRMISKDIFMTQEFMSMSLSAQALYSWLVLFADDEGFVGIPDRVTVMIGAEESALDELINSGFVIRFKTGVAVIEKWEEFNKISSKRIIRTKFLSEQRQYHKMKLMGSNKKVLSLTAEN